MGRCIVLIYIWLIVVLLKLSQDEGVMISLRKVATYHRIVGFLPSGAGVGTREVIKVSHFVQAVYAPFQGS